MTLVELQAAIKTIIRDAESRIANLAPESRETLAHLIQAHWPDADEVELQVLAEAEWVLSKHAEQENKHES